MYNVDNYMTVLTFCHYLLFCQVLNQGSAGTERMTNGRRLLMNIIIWGFLSFSQHVPSSDASAPSIIKGLFKRLSCGFAQYTIMDLEVTKNKKEGGKKIKKLMQLDPFFILPF